MNIGILVSVVLCLPIERVVEFIRENAEVIVALIAAIGACVAGAGAFWSAHRTKMAVEGRLFLEQMHEYASKEMRDELRRLFKWGRTQRGKNLSEKELKKKAKLWISNLFNEKNFKLQRSADETDLARRHVTHYFLNSLLLYESKYISERFFKRWCKAIGIEILNVLLPLEEALIRDIGKKNHETSEGIEKKITRLKDKFDKIRDIVR